MSGANIALPLDQLQLLRKHDTDKTPCYLRTYERYFAPLRNCPITLLEMGILNGGSLRLWREYFPNAKIIGVDQFVHVWGDGFICYEMNQGDTEAWNRLVTMEGPFDIVIDDASHVGHLTRTAFNALFPAHIKAGGLYCIEDWGTGYWPTWPNSDGAAFQRGHYAGMVGVVKDMVDRVAYKDISHPEFGVRGQPTESFIDHLHIQHGLCVIQKKRDKAE
jgi:hypothetical protein